MAIRAFFPAWVLLYVAQFILWPLISRNYWYDALGVFSTCNVLLTVPRISLFLGNTLYLAAFGYYVVISFLGYNSTLLWNLDHLLQLYLTIFKALPFLNHTQFLLSPLLLFGVLWLASLFGFNIPQHLGPLFKLGAG